MNDAATPVVLDASTLATLRQLSEPGEPDVLVEVLTLFRADAPARLQAIEAAVAARDARSLQRAAHTMKGASGTIGAVALQQACRVVEELAKDGALDRVDEALAPLPIELARVLTAIEQLLSSKT